MKTRLARHMACMLSHLAFWAVMLLAFAPHAGTFWYCGEPSCSSTAWMGCCLSQSEDCQAKGNASQVQGQKSSTQIPAHMNSCPPQCHCSLVVSATTRSLVHPQAFLFSCVCTAFIFPCITNLNAPKEDERFYSDGSRGPPFKSVYLTIPALRGPPLA